MAAFDMADPSFDPFAVKALLKADDDADAWWRHIPGACLIDAKLPVQELSRRLKQHSGDASLLVVEARLGQSSGGAPTRSWGWIKRRNRDASDQESRQPATNG